MPYVVGVVLGVLTALLTRAARFDRDRAVYPTILIVVALYYVLFAVMGASIRALVLESLVMLGFTAVAVLGFARNLWWVVGGLAGHATFDLVHSLLIANPGVPVWWPAFCLSIDAFLAAWLAGLILRKRIPPLALGSHPRP